MENGTVSVQYPHCYNQQIRILKYNLLVELIKLMGRNHASISALVT